MALPQQCRDLSQLAGSAERIGRSAATSTLTLLPLGDGQRLEAALCRAARWGVRAPWAPDQAAGLDLGEVENVS